MTDPSQWKSVSSFLQRMMLADSTGYLPNDILVKIDRAAIVRIFSRDDPKAFDPAVAAALADYELALGDQVPNGTYIDMAIHLPMVDPTQVSCPVLMIRAQTDGNATEEELLTFFSKLPNRDKQFIMLRGISHVGLLETNRKRVWHVMREFMTLPAPVT